MLTFRTILHPTDFSKRSQSAFALACALARDHGSQLIVLHVVEMATIGYGEGVVPPNPVELRAEVQEQLNRLQVPHENVRAERRLEEGDAVTEILRVGQEVGADLIVMGTHGRSGLSRLLMGSVAEQVVRRAACPVLTVKSSLPVAVPSSEFQAEPAETLRRVNSDRIPDPSMP